MSVESPLRLKQNSLVVYQGRIYKARAFYRARDSKAHANEWLLNGPMTPHGHPEYHAYVKDDDPNVQPASPELSLAPGRRFHHDYHDRNCNCGKCAR